KESISVISPEMTPLISAPLLAQASGTKTQIVQDSGLDVDLVVDSVNGGLMPSVYRSFGGASRMILIKQPEKPVPRLFAVEEYKVCSYLGNYGAGKTVKTFTLLPGERTTITINSYTDKE